jgi:hypothetical protein
VTPVITSNFATETSYEVKEISLFVKFAEDGRGVMRKQWHGIKARQAFQNLTIPFDFGTSPSGSLEEPSVETLAGSSRPVSMEEKLKTGTGWKGTLLIHGPFFPGSGQVSFQLVQPFGKAYCMNRQEAELAYKHDAFKLEYCAASVYAPTDSLKFEVSFPPSHEKLDPEPSPVAFIGETESIHIEETKRIKANGHFTGGVATLTIDSPVIGLRYAISWMPP